MVCEWEVQFYLVMGCWFKDSVLLVSVLCVCERCIFSRMCIVFFFYLCAFHMYPVCVVISGVCMGG